MLHTKSRGNRSTGSGEEDFEGFFTRTEQNRTEHILYSLKTCEVMS